MAHKRVFNEFPTVPYALCILISIAADNIFRKPLFTLSLFICLLSPCYSNYNNYYTDANANTNKLCAYQHWLTASNMNSQIIMY